MAKTSKTYRVGVIGAGSIAQACHMPGYHKNVHAGLVAFADPVPARHKEVHQAFPGMTGYKDFREMLKKEDLDVVSVCTPNKFHAQQAIAAMKAGCHVLCEKPIATTLKQADNMIETAKATRKKLMVGFTHRLISGPQQCKEILSKKGIGKPFMIRVRFAHGGPYPGWAKDRWFYDQKLAAGGAMLDMGIHAIDQCLWLFGPVKAVSAKAVTMIKKIEVDDNALMLLEFRNGALGYIEVGWTSKPGFTGIEIYGTEGSLICDYINGLQKVGGIESAGGDGSSEWETINKKPAAGGWEVEIDHWMEVVRGKAKNTMTGKDGRNALEVALAAYKSSKTGRRIQIG